MGGRIYIDGLGDYGDWNPGRLIFYPTEVVDMLLKPYPQDRRVHTVEELRSAVQESKLPSYRLWIREGLIEAARSLLRSQQSARF
jgi:hypothetical protein